MSRPRVYRILSDNDACQWTCPLTFQELVDRILLHMPPTMSAVDLFEPKEKCDWEDKLSANEQKFLHGYRI